MLFANNFVSTPDKQRVIFQFHGNGPVHNDPQAIRRITGAADNFAFGISIRARGQQARVLHVVDKATQRQRFFVVCRKITDLFDR